MRKLMLIFSLFFFSGCETAQQVLSGMSNDGLTTPQIAAGLKEALSVGIQNGTTQLSAVDGFFANAAIKILMPEEVKKVESTLRSVGLGSVVDNAVLSMNRAAEDAAKSAKPIFLNAIKQMTITDAIGILKGGDFAATDYFKNKTTAALIQAFSPSIQNSLEKVNATKYWKEVFTVYNRFSTTPVNTDLTQYVTKKAVDGIFYEVGLEEQKIRKNPAARVTDLLKKVFGSQMAKGN